MAKTSTPGRVPGAARGGKGRPRLLLAPVSVRVDIEAKARDAAMGMLQAAGHASLSEMIRASLDFYIQHHATNNN